MPDTITHPGKLNGICPYFTMFPLEFPYDILKGNAGPGEWVADPFCGRGTTNYAGRLLGLPSIGIDSSAVATAIAKAKIADTSPERILLSARRILDEISSPDSIPQGEFWELAYHADVLSILCRLREGLLNSCRSASRIALRAIILGALHGPQSTSIGTYFSNQSPRTYAPKPQYATKYWREKSLAPQRVDVLSIIKKRAIRYYQEKLPITEGTIIKGDSRSKLSYTFLAKHQFVKWVITSPPYYGMRTYLPDQWIRSWFLGGPEQVDYTNDGQIEHSSPELFATQLNQVWRNMANICVDTATMVVRFGAINDRKADHLEILRKSFHNSGWRIQTIADAGNATYGKRQSDQFGTVRRNPIQEHDVWATRDM